MQRPVALLALALLVPAAGPAADSGAGIDVAAVSKSPAITADDPLEQDLQGCVTAAESCSWDRTYGGPAEDKAYAVVGLDDDGVLLAGNTGSSGPLGFDAWLLRLDRQGDPVWERRLGGRGNDQVYAARRFADGVVVAGHTRSTRGGDSDAWIFRVDQAGEMVWQRVLGGAGAQRARGLAVAGEDRVLVAGTDSAPTTSGTDGWLTALDADGDQVWERRYGGQGDDGLFAVAVDAAGAFAVGYTESAGERGYDLWVVRTDRDGEPVWERRLHRNLFDAATGAAVTPDGGVIIAGISSVDAFRGDDAWVLRLDADGAVVWERFYGGSEPDGAWALAGLGNDRYLVVVATQSAGAGSMDARLLELDGQGERHRDRLFGFPLWDRPTSVDLATNGDVLVGGYTTSRGNGFEDYWVLRLGW